VSTPYYVLIEHEETYPCWFVHGKDAAELCERIRVDLARQVREDGCDEDRSYDASRARAKCEVLQRWLPFPTEEGWHDPPEDLVREAEATHGETTLWPPLELLVLHVAIGRNAAAELLLSSIIGWLDQHEVVPVKGQEDLYARDLAADLVIWIDQGGPSWDRLEDDDMPVNG